LSVNYSEILEKGHLEEQLNYLEERTRIYEDYRANREDMFQLVKKNSIDSLSSGKNRINSLIARNNNLSSEIDSLNNTLSLTRNDLDEAVRTKNSIRLLGMNLNKFAYNTIMWIITGVCVFFL
jgi:DNA repair ATPase RecN